MAVVGAAGGGGGWLGVRVDTDVDVVEEWTRAQARVIGLVEDLPPDRAALRVPACPDWTVRDLFSHVVGLGTDVLAGDEPADHNAVWTGRQVALRRSLDVAALVAEWSDATEQMRAYLRDDPRPLGDVIIHEQDLRGALGVPGAQDTPGLRAIRDRFAPRFGGRVAELPPVALVGRAWSWTSAGSAEDAPTVLRAPDFDLARALVTRRSAAQLRAWTVRGDVTPYLDAFAALGPLPAVDLTES